MKSTVASSIATEVAAQYGLSAAQVFADRTGALSHVRAHVYREAQTRFCCSEKEIAEAFGRDTTSVRAALRRQLGEP